MTLLALIRRIYIVHFNISVCCNCPNLFFFFFAIALIKGTRLAKLLERFPSKSALAAGREEGFHI